MPSVLGACHPRIVPEPLSMLTGDEHPAVVSAVRCRTGPVRPLRGGMAGTAGGFPAVAGGVRVLRPWAQRGLPERLVDRLRGQLRVGAGRAELPTAAVIDSQSVKAADTVGAATSGYDGGKKNQGPQAARRGGQQRVAAGGAGHRGRRAGPRRRSSAGGAAAGTVVHDHAGVGRRRVRRALVVWAAAVLTLTVTVVERTDPVSG